jgi:hypothetical protein
VSPSRTAATSAACTPKPTPRRGPTTRATIRGVSERLRPKIRHMPDGSGRAYA